MRTRALLRHLPGLGVAVALGGAIAGPTLARAEAGWLLPSRWQAGPRDTVGVAFFRGEAFHGVPAGWRRPDFLAFRLHGYRDVSLAGACADGDTLWARFVPVDAEGVMLFAQTNWRVERWSPARVAAARAGAAPPAPDGAAMSDAGVPVRVSTCAKAWIPGSAGARWAEPLGGRLEIVPLVDPATADPLLCRVLEDGRPVAGVTVTVWRAGADGGAGRDAATAPAASGRTRADGTVDLRVRGAGPFLVDALRVKPGADSAAGAWEARAATLTFARSGTSVTSGSR